MTLILNTDQLLEAYRAGCFPMADDRHAQSLAFYRPEKRGIIPLEGFHLPRSLKKFMERQPFDIRFNSAFSETVEACAQINDARRETWINDQIIQLYAELNEKGHAHSVECWQKNVLVGGLYGVHINGAFFGESMFSRVSNASRVALVALVQTLQKEGFLLLDTQYWNPHLEQFGCIEIGADYFQHLLKGALAKPCSFGQK